MTRYMSLDETLLKDFEYPVCLVVEVTKQGVLLSKLRYLKTLGQVVNETIRCPVIEVYMHMGKFVDPFLFKGGARPIGIDWIFGFELDKSLFKETMAALRSGKAQINRTNPMIENFIPPLMKKIESGKLNFKRLEAVEKGLLLEPYCKLAFQKAGKGKIKILQNAELIDREASIRVRGPGYEDIYNSEPGPVMEIDILVLTEISDVHDLLDSLGQFGFFLDRPS
ncbi:MAG: hypothetical protein KKH41_00695 [Candidatus Thermoplasmatota archaeon]|nr:hypothetical protein [Euryarchaeota archaeon]MBU4032248.1 hypothetical protein [Candidatus Thermoplasmatota archaeon]MBU4071435.1 hypothetical protein [Candidatus Thermoplasmatota archaeon]MBU4144419.1 hypothetical protein [Candidatus Thermoplasmatota archaeon]MBU4591079.1 hypothetical protein [Candidatus Thermoplasmatota archaeon]